MIPKISGSRDSGKKGRITAVKASLRRLNNQLSMLDHRIAVQAGLKDVDLDCLDMIERDGPLSPSAIARRAGLHPATVTGILDRLQRGGWITRDRDPDASDRRAVTVGVRRDRNAELYRHYAGMNRSIDEICATYTVKELELLQDFVDRLVAAGHDATEKLGRPGS